MNSSSNLRETKQSFNWTCSSKSLIRVFKTCNWS